MAIKFNRSQTFATNGTVTAAGLHNLIDGTDIYQALITDQTAMTSVGSLDKLLIADSDLTAGDAPRSVTVNELFEDALTLSTYTNVNAVNLKYTSATGNYTLSTGATITNGTIANGTITSGTIPTLTAGTTTSTAANITNGTVQTLTASTANITTGTVATLNSTTGTIGALVATGTITGSTNVVNIGSGQIYKDASGNVGIGTTSPIRKLSIDGGGLAFQSAGGTNRSISWIDSTTTSAPVYLVGDSTSTGCYFAVNTSAFGTSGTERLRIDSSGNVGIGNTSPNGKLDVVGGRSFFSAASEQFGIGVRYISTGGPVYFGAASASATPDAVISAAGGASLMTLQNGGNVGIGTTTPVNKLEIVGSFGRGAPVTKTGDFTLADTENWIIVNKGSSCTVTLPAASSWTGREFTIKTIQAFAVVSASSNVIPRISGAAGTAILGGTDGAWATLVSNGTNWEIMCGS